MFEQATKRDGPFIGSILSLDVTLTLEITKGAIKRIGKIDQTVFAR
jgi:hypothetical protein